MAMNGSIIILFGLLLSAEGASAGTGISGTSVPNTGACLSGECTPYDIQLYTVPGAPNAGVWRKPVNAQIVSVFGCGGAGGGGGGALATFGTTLGTSGGGGGGAADCHTTIYKASDLPDEIVVFVGWGGGDPRFAATFGAATGHGASTPDSFGIAGPAGRDTLLGQIKATGGTGVIETFWHGGSGAGGGVTTTTVADDGTITVTPNPSGGGGGGGRGSPGGHADNINAGPGGILTGGAGGIGGTGHIGSVYEGGCGGAGGAADGTQFDSLQACPQPNSNGGASGGGVATDLTVHPGGQGARSTGCTTASVGGNQSGNPSPDAVVGVEDYNYHMGCNGAGGAGVLTGIGGNGAAAIGWGQGGGGGGSGCSGGSPSCTATNGGNGGRGSGGVMIIISR